MHHHADLIDFMDQLYRVDEPLPDSEWLARILETACQLIDFGLGATAFTYDLDVHMKLAVLSVAASSNGEACAQSVSEFSQNLSQPCVAASYGLLLCAATSELPAFADSAGRKTLCAHGVEDVFGINGMNPGGTSVAIGVPSPKRLQISHPLRARWEHIAAHMAASYRLRKRLAAETRADSPVPLHAEAVIKPTGQIEHAEGSAKGKLARDALRDGVQQLTRARQRRDDPDRAIKEWRGLIAARWTLVEMREIGGRRYFLACENQNAGPRVSALTGREQQVAVFASFGYSHKLIAYHLGISASTSRVLLLRALTKLGVSSREELAALLLASA